MNLFGVHFDKLDLLFVVIAAIAGGAMAVFLAVVFLL